MAESDYLPFGLPTSELGSHQQKIAFTGHHRIVETAMQNFGTRVYAPEMGRFIQPDEGLEGFDSDGLNVYAYVRNRPTSLVDPDGRDSQAPQFDPKIGNNRKAAIAGWEQRAQRDGARAVDLREGAEAALGYSPRLGGGPPRRGQKVSAWTIMRRLSRSPGGGMSFSDSAVAGFGGATLAISSLYYDVRSSWGIYHVQSLMSAPVGMQFPAPRLEDAIPGLPRSLPPVFTNNSNNTVTVTTVVGGVVVKQTFVGHVESGPDGRVIVNFGADSATVSVNGKTGTAKFLFRSRAARRNGYGNVSHQIMLAIYGLKPLSED